MPTPVTSANQLRNVVSPLAQDPELASILIILLVSVVDPAGDPQRYALADNVLQYLYTCTPEFDSAYRDYLAAA